MDNFLRGSIIDFINKYGFLFFNKKNVLGIGLGYKEIKNMITKELCLHVLVKKKVLAQNLYEKDKIPKSFLGIKTDVIETGELNIKNSISNDTISVNEKDIQILRKKTKIIQAGYSIGPFHKVAGTIGGIVFDNNDERIPYMLSCNHVFTRGNKGKKGSSILQPGVTDGGYYNGNIMGNLYEKIDFIYNKSKEDYKNPQNVVDAAIAKFDSKKLLYSTDIYKIGKLTDISQGNLGNKVQKVGRTTGYTTAVVISTNVSTNFQMEYGICSFKELIRTNHLGDGGDSGSLVVNFENKVIGLLIGGSNRSDYIAPIETVLNYLNIHFDFDN
ncbi:hypothetical protein [Clostridium tarantellae]|uniref:Trypsin-like serine protease n=1 Tax=Clostridium tarantellae TaxID=39493 RepID=A0A6I1MJ12_9CLOT|nr:hypothetical protein [Clostridium tarantellae]MPQ42914.1 hypothetical protein [Clostridium tarantellae]